MNFDEAQDLTAMLLMQSVAARAKAAFRVQPEIRVDRTSWTGEPEYQIEIMLPPGKYLYAVDLEQFASLAMHFEGAKATADGTLHAYWSMRLNRFIALQKPQERKVITGHDRPAAPGPQPKKPQKEPEKPDSKPKNRTLF